MNLSEAVHIVGATSEREPFPTNSKMPGPSYDLPASACRRGADLAVHRDSPCHPKNCYAKRGFFQMRHVQDSEHRHLASLNHPLWVHAFVLILKTVYRRQRHFRWHASGDLQGTWHLWNLIEVARRASWMKFWLPTRELPTVLAAIDAMDDIPVNLTIRVSADRIGQPAASWSFPTSTIHHEFGHPPPGAYECRAHDRDNACGPCRACWSRNAARISYPLTTTRGVTGTGRRSPQLRLFHADP